MGKPYITRQGYDLLHEELTFLWEVKRPDVTQKVSWAASLGDRSENADYQYNKRLLAQIDRRIRYLRTCLNKLQVVDYNKQQDGKVFFGAYVEIEADDNEQILRIRIVGSDEIFSRDNYISIDSPMAKALLGKAEGDDAVVNTPKGQRLWYVNKIAYKKPNWFEELEPQTFVKQDDNAFLELQIEEVDETDVKKIQMDYLKALAK